MISIYKVYSYDEKINQMNELNYILHNTYNTLDGISGIYLIHSAGHFMPKRNGIGSSVAGG